MFGKKSRMIAEQASKIQELEKTIAELTQKIDDYSAREFAISRTMTDATIQADKIVSDAQREAGDILEQSQISADEAKRNSEQVVEKAYQDARDIVKDAEAQSRQKLDDTQAKIDDYAGLLRRYDELIQENIRNAEQSARQYAEVAGKLRAVIPQIVTSDGKLIGAAEEPESIMDETETPAEEPETESTIPEEQSAAKEPEVPDTALAEEGGEPEEKLWTVSEVAQGDAGEPVGTDAIIDGVLGQENAE